MGCSASHLEADPPARPAKTQPSSTRSEMQQADDNIPEPTWHADRSWTDWIVEMEQSSIEKGVHDQFFHHYTELVFTGARNHIERLYPECASQGTIEAMPTMPDLIGGNHPNPVPTKNLLVLDPSQGGVIHAIVLIVAKPPRQPREPSEQQQAWAIPGAEVESPEMQVAKHMLLLQATVLEARGTNTSHLAIHIFVGGDLLACRYDDSPNKQPTITKRLSPMDRDLLKAINVPRVKAAKKSPDAYRGLFAPYYFRQIVRDAMVGFPGCTVWDEGPLPFRLETGMMYDLPTRVLVTRVFGRMNGDKADEVHLTVQSPALPGSVLDEPVTLVRRADPAKDPGGIVRIVLIIGLGYDVVWPKVGDYALSAVLKAGEKAAQAYAKRLYAQGKLEFASIRVYMGVDNSNSYLVGDHKAITVDELQTRQLPHPKDTRNTAPSAAPPVDDGSLERDFNLKVTLQPRHDLFGSESQFQAIKQHMQELSKGVPNRDLNAQAVQIAPRSAQHFLETNFPGCAISQEGLFPVINPDGTQTRIPDTCLVVAGDARGQIVAVVHGVPCPAGMDGEPMMFSDKQWVGTPEMRQAEGRLLELLRRWYGEGRLAGGECLAQCMLGKDASTYRFVGGRGFEEYGEERMKQLKWG